MLKPTSIMLAAGLSMAALLPTVASAHTDVSIGVVLGGPALYEAPPPRYYAPQPVVVYDAPRWHEDRGYRGDDDRWEHARWQQEHRRHEWREHEWHEHHGDWRD